MWGTSVKKKEETFDRDNSYVRALQQVPTEETGESRPFDEQRETTRESAPEAAGSSDVGNGTSSFESGGAVQLSVREEEAPTVQEGRADSYSGAGASESSRSSSGIASQSSESSGGSIDVDCAPSKEHASPPKQIQRLTKEELLFLSAHGRATPSSLGDSHFSRSSSHFSKHSHGSGTNSHADHVSVFSYKSNKSRQSGKSRKSSQSRTTEMSAEEAEEAYNRICCGGSYEATPTTANSKTVSKVMDRVMACGSPPRLPGAPTTGTCSELGGAGANDDETVYTAADTVEEPTKAAELEKKLKAPAEEASNNVPSAAVASKAATVDAQPRLNIHSSRGKLSFRKLKSKRYFGKKASATEMGSVAENPAEDDVVEETVASHIRVMESGEAKDDDEIELMYGANDWTKEADMLMPRVRSTKSVASHHTDETERVTLDTKEDDEVDVALVPNPDVCALTDNLDSTHKRQQVDDVTGLFDMLFTCGTPTQCESPGNRFDRKGVATREDPLVLYDDDVDEALNVEVYGDEIDFIGADFMDDFAEEEAWEVDSSNDQDSEAEIASAKISAVAVASTSSDVAKNLHQRKNRVGLFKRIKAKKQKERTRAEQLEMNFENEKLATMDENGLARTCSATQGQSDDALDVAFAQEC